MKPLLSRLQYILPFLGASSSQVQLQSDPWPRQTYKSSNAQPPDLLIGRTGTTASGLLFFSESGWSSPEHDNLVIISDANDLVWQSAPGTLSSFKPQILFGKPVLVYWVGTILPRPWGMGIGKVEILDNTYTPIHTVSISGKEQNLVPAAGLDPKNVEHFVDIHEAYITPDNTILVAAFNSTPYDLSAFGGPIDGWMHDSLLFELDVETSAVLHRWSALEHLDELGVNYKALKYPLGEMGRNKTHPYAFFHLNSVDKFSDGSYLISSRHTCSVYRVGSDGAVQWVLQGDGMKSSFNHGPGVSFSYQHDARIHEVSKTSVTLSLFDNNNDFGKPIRESKGLVIKLDTVKMEATLKKELVDPEESLSAPVLGSVQALDNGSTLVGYGYVPKMKEFDSEGNVIMTVQFGRAGETSAYRSYRHRWVGQPATPPNAYACFDGRDTQVYMSWNGSTEHAAWNVFSGNEPSALRKSGRVRSSGFESVATIQQKAYFVQVEPVGKTVVPVNSSIIEVEAKC